MRSLTYVVDICPIGWKRAGLNGNRFFDRQKEEKLLFGLHLNQQHKDIRPFDIPIELDITYYFPYPRKTAKIKPTYYSNVPDLDNLIKMTCDILTDCNIITDDRIIAKIISSKLYGMIPRTEFTIRELE